jgi:putative flippase GtrA
MTHNLMNWSDFLGRQTRIAELECDACGIRWRYCMTRQTIAEIVRFLVVGGAAYLVYVSVFTMLRFMGDAAALTLAYSVSLVVHYGLNSSWTFRVRQFANLRVNSAPRYVVVCIATYLISTAAALSLLHFDANPTIALAIGILVSTPVSFMASRYWVFK